MFYRVFIVWLFLLCSVFSYGQKSKNKRPPVLPVPTAGYVYQGTHNLFAAIGPGHLFQRHSFIALQAGLVYFRTNKTGYFSPNITLKYFYQLNNKYLMGPIINANYTSYKINGSKDNYLSFDAGFVIIGGWTLFGGYNYNLDKKDHDQITPYRVGVRLM